MMNTRFSPNHFITSINFTYFSNSNDSNRNVITKMQNQKNEDKENNGYNTNINIVKKNKYDKLRLTLQKNPVKKKILKHNIEKNIFKINLESYRTVPLKIFEPNSFNNTSIHYTKHKNKIAFISDDSVNVSQRKNEEQKAGNYADKEKNNFLLLNNSIDFTNNKNFNKHKRKKDDNSNYHISIENESFSNTNKHILNSNFSCIRYKTEAKNAENDKLNNHMNKSNEHFQKFFSPPKLEISKKVAESELKKSCRILSERRNNDFKSSIINPNDFKIIKQIGFGSFGKIYKALCNKNGQKYVLKVMHNNKNNIIYLQEKVRIIMDFEKRTKCDGLIQIYGDACIKKGSQYYYYEVLELAERDWEQEIIIRRRNLKYYSEHELINIMWQLVKTLSLLQKNHITHRDIKLQNILLLSNKYKICDFGESRKLIQKGVIVQPVRGSELYMSPIQFFGLEKSLDCVQHNTYKSDVFSLGMCILFAANLSDECLYDIREITDMEIIKNIVMSYLNRRYSIKFIHLLLILLEFQEKNRPDFISLEQIIFNSFNNNKRKKNFY